MMKDEKNINKKSGKMIFIISAAVIGVALLLFAGISESSSAKREADGSEEYSEMDAEVYAKDTEEKIARLCEDIYGVKNVKVAVSLSGGYNAVYAQNSQSNSSGYKNEFVLTGNGSSEKPLLIGYSVPEISGVGIVCYGGGDARIRQEIISLVGAALGISANKIYVTEAKS